MKIISLVPSITYTLFSLGLENELIGRTKFCKLPFNKLDKIPMLGGTKNPYLDKIVAKNPDLIIVNCEENRKEDFLYLKEKSKAEILITNVYNLSSNHQMIIEIGEKTNTYLKAKSITEKIKENFTTLKQQKTKQLCTYLIWKNPYITVGGDTFINSMLTKAGFNNYFKAKRKYPKINLNEIPPQKILLSSEPFPFNESHKKELMQEYPQHEFICIDGTFFSWFGSYVINSPGYFLNFLKK